MSGRFTLGIEEEFQLVDCQSLQLCSCVSSVLEKGAPYGTGADRQIAVYEQNGDIHKVVELLMEQTMQGITLDAADLSHDFLKFKRYEEPGKN